MLVTTDMLRLIILVVYCLYNSIRSFTGLKHGKYSFSLFVSDSMGKKVILDEVELAATAETFCTLLST